MTYIIIDKNMYIVVYIIYTDLYSERTSKDVNVSLSFYLYYSLNKKTRIK